MMTLHPRFRRQMLEAVTGLIRTAVLEVYVDTGWSIELLDTVEMPMRNGRTVRPSVFTSRLSGHAMAVLHTFDKEGTWVGSFDVPSFRSGALVDVPRAQLEVYP